jgi:hypothetical protein
VYIVPSRVKSCSPISQCLLSDSSPKQENTKRLPQIHTELYRLESFAAQFDFVYPDTRGLFDLRHKDFLVVKHSVAATQKKEASDKACLKELNRLARIVELSKDTSCLIYPCYTPPHLVDSRRRRLYSKCFPSVFDSRLKHELKLDSTFAKAFPKTTIPKCTFTKGHPVFAKADFNALLFTKLQQAREFYKTVITPSHLPRLITSWICALFKYKSTTPTAPKKEQKAKKALAKPEIPLADRFVSASDSTVPQQISSSPTRPPTPTIVPDNTVFTFDKSFSTPTPLAKSTWLPNADGPTSDILIEFDSQFPNFPSTFDGITLRDLSKRMQRHIARKLTTSADYTDVKIDFFYEDDNFFFCLISTLKILEIQPHLFFSIYPGTTAPRLRPSLFTARVRALCSCLTDLTLLY